jgi:ABC-type nitrate/sulfonate/bicarbonate transport system ATPase subunit
VTVASPGRATDAGPDLVFSCRGASVELPHQHGARRVLDDISIELARGEILTIVGPSGTGKTTLLRLLGGLTRATRGAVYVNGALIDGPPVGVNLVFQDYSHALLQWRTVGRNVAIGLEGRLPRGEIEERVRDALRLVRLEAHADDYPWQLSGGMQQRVQIARALALRPAVLLMDEPFAALDAMTKATLQDELLQVREQTGSSVVFVTHDIEEAVYLGDRVAVITGAPGRIERTVAVDLPKPRDQVVTRQLPKFLELRYLLHQAIGQSAHA